MSEWIKKLIEKHTCVFCEKKLDKKDIYTINMDTLDGPHSVTSCEKCAMEFDEVLKGVEEVINGKGV